MGFLISCLSPRGGGTPNKGRYRCAASAKPRLGKISQKNLMPGQKSAQKPDDWASFHDFQSAKIENFQQVGHFFHSFINYYTFSVKNCQKPNAWAKFTSQKPNALACTSVPTFIRESPPRLSRFQVQQKFEGGGNLPIF